MHGPLRKKSMSGCHWLLASPGWHWLPLSQCRRTRPDRGKHRLLVGQCHPTRAGFTLIELLIVITVIGLLSAIVLAALQSARETAKAAKTKATITKLHYVIMARYDSYRTRRVPVDTKGLHPQEAAFVRLFALRDLMRMEMPDRWSDVIDGPIPRIPTDPTTAIDQPSISLRYLRLLTAAGGPATASEHAAAECLYMIVMSIPEAAEQFHSTEIGDVDNDGLKEFVDGWGHPIRFIRWPVGFVDPGILDFLRPSASPPYNGQTGPAGAVGGSQLIWSSPSDLQSGNRREQPDPFDSMGVYGFFGGFAVVADITPGANNATGPGFAVFPLIYSAGSDGIYDINLGFQQDASGKDVPFVYQTLDYFRPDLNNGTADDDGYRLRYIGQPLDAPSIDGSPANGSLNHYDNIHNHVLEVR